MYESTDLKNGFQRIVLSYISKKQVGYYFVYSTAKIKIPRNTDSTFLEMLFKISINVCRWASLTWPTVSLRRKKKIKIKYVTSLKCKKISQCFFENNFRCNFFNRLWNLEEWLFSFIFFPYSIILLPEKKTQKLKIRNKKVPAWWLITVELFLVFMLQSSCLTNKSWQIFVKKNRSLYHLWDSS